MESNMMNDMHLGIDEAYSCHPSGVPTESAVCGQQELHNLLNVLRPYGTARNPVGAQDIKQADLSPAFTHNAPIIIAGPCSVESEEQILATARALAEIPEVKMLRGGIWKPRTRPDAFEGMGERGLVWLREAPVSPDLKLWIGAFERFQKAGVTHLAAIHRGFAYYKESPYRNYPMWEIPIELTRQLNVPLITDVSHICGNRELLLPTAQKALDLASDGLMIECHINPDEALTDAKQQITPEALKTMLASLTFRSKQSCHVERDLAGWRGEIDDIDAELLQLLARRMEISAQIGEYKKQNNVTVVQMDRWKQVLDGLMVTGQELGLSPILINKVFEAIHQASIDRQARIMEDE